MLSRHNARRQVQVPRDATPPRRSGRGEDQERPKRAPRRPGESSIPTAMAASASAPSLPNYAPVVSSSSRLVVRLVRVPAVEPLQKAKMDAIKGRAGCPCRCELMKKKKKGERGRIDVARK